MVCLGTMDGDAPKKAAHGVGDRSSYYKKWDKVAKETTEEIEREESVIKAAEAAARAKDPASEAERKDREKRAALKEAKKLWDGVAAVEDSKKVIIGDESNQQDKTLDFGTEVLKRVVVFKKNSDCHYHLPDSTSLIKVFVEECKRCHITVHCNIATSSIELSRCEDVNITLINHPAHTVQIDLCQNIRVCYAPSLFIPGDSKIYHSDVSGLRIGLNWDHSQPHDESGTNKLHHVPDHSELSEQHAHVLSRAVVAISEQQFVTSMVDGVLTTDVVLRDTGGHPTTLRELEERRKSMEQSLSARGLDVTGDVAKKVLRDFDPLTVPEQALRYKEEGNKAFKECDYGQAGVHYTQAIETFQNCPPLPEGSTDTTVKDGLCAALSNRAACSLKLGDHLNALADCDACLALDPAHVKCLFRKGLALHALGRYREACPALGKALQLEPKNAQIRSALTFAERKATLSPA